MRKRVYRERADSGQQGLDIKGCRGGITDIEFLVQFLVLSGLTRHPDLVTYSDIIRQLESLESEDLISPSDAVTLRDAWLSYRTRVHHLDLDRRHEEVDASEFEHERSMVSDIWRRFLGDDPEAG
jgi:glutamate-ammonia-ligase adenylyltransferase